MSTKEKTNKKKIIAFAVLGILTVALLVVGVMYTQKVNFYKSHFLPATTINGIDCSDMDMATVTALLNEQIGDYSLTVLGRDEAGNQVELGKIEAEDIALELENGDNQVAEVLVQQNPSRFLYAGKSESYSYQVVPVVTFDEELLEKQAKSFEAFQKKNMIAPEDAYISEYIDESNSYEIVSEVKGTKLDVDLAISCMKTLVLGFGESVDLVEQNCYQEPAVLADDKKLVSTLETLNKWVGAEITYDWNTYEVVVDGDLIKDWIVMENGKTVLDEEAIADFVKENANKYDTYGKTRDFTTTLGVTLTLGTGGFGWKTDQSAVTEDLIAMIKDGKVTKTEPTYSNTAPRRGMNDIGNSYVEIDLSNQHLYLYYDGVNVFESDFVSGDMDSTPGCVTPAGVFDITYKTTNAILRGSDYAEPVSYWMPFYGNYGMHDATWRTEFGGDIFLTDGSHGCVNLPLESAATIYNYVKTGFPVICYYY